MVHGQAITDGDGRKFKRHAAGVANAVLDGVGDAAQVGVAGNDLVVGIDHGDERFVHFLVGQTEGIQERTVGGTAG